MNNMGLNVVFIPVYAKKTTTERRSKVKKTRDAKYGSPGFGAPQLLIAHSEQKLCMGSPTSVYCVL